VTVAVGLGTAALAWGGLLLVALPHGLGNLMLGSIWRPTYVLVLPQTLAIVGQAFSSGAATGIGALGAANRALRAAVIASIAFLICGVLGPVLGGAMGTMIGAMISAWIGALAFWWELRGAMREHAIVNVGRRRGTDKQGGRHRRTTEAGAPVQLSDDRDREAPMADHPLCSAVFLRS
jgi:hypothetical protein